MDISLPWKKGMNLMALLTKKLLRCISLISVQLIEAGTYSNFEYHVNGEEYQIENDIEQEIHPVFLPSCPA